MDDREAQGYAIRRLRGDRTQTLVAESCGIPRSVWNRYEKGSRLAGPEARRKIAEGLGCTLLQLEREMWEARSKRLAAEEAADSTIGEPTEPYRLLMSDERPAELLLKEIREHTSGISHHIEGILLLLLRQPTS